MKRLMYIVFSVNFLFSLLTTILPLLTLEVTGSPATAGYVITIFMLALLSSRIVLLKYDIDAYHVLKYGLISYCVGFLLLFINASDLIFYYIGSIFFGVGIGFVVPILLTIITNEAVNVKKAVGVHNSFLGIASAVAPFVGLSLFYAFSDREIVYVALFLVSMTAFLISWGMKARKEQGVKKDHTIRKEIFTLDYSSSYLVFLLVSISYGAIIAFSPILLEERGLRVDVFYFFFWSFFILSQIYTMKVREYIRDRYLQVMSMVLISMSTLMLVASHGYALLIMSAVVFGFFYGGLMNLFYVRIGMVKDNKSKAGAYSIFGLMSYLGVGLSPIFLSPLATNSLTTVFMISAVFPVIALGMHFLLEVIRNKRCKRNDAKKDVAL